MDVDVNNSLGCLDNPTEDDSESDDDKSDEFFDAIECGNSDYIYVDAYQKVHDNSMDAFVAFFKNMKFSCDC